MTKITALAEQLKALDERVDAEEGFDQQLSLGANPHFKRLVAILSANPILVQAAAQWAAAKEAELAAAKLSVLYSPEQISEMRKLAGIK